MWRWAFALCFLRLSLAYCPLTSNKSPSRPKCFSFYNWNKTFAEAEGFCNEYARVLRALSFSLGGHLASVTNAFEASLLSTVAQGKGVPDNFWLGGNDIAQPGQFAWLDSTQWNYVRWAAGQPSAKQMCLSVGNLDGTWTSADCSLRQPFACAADVVSAAKPPCDSGWTWYSNASACYRVFFDVRTWQDAEALCTSVGAHLSSIHDAGENRFVNELAKSGLTVSDNQEIYIGLQRDSQSQFVWTDGSKTDYLNWAPGEPNNADGKESCVETYADPLSKPPKNADYVEKWNDIPCTDTMRAGICKKSQNS